MSSGVRPPPPPITLTLRRIGSFPILPSKENRQSHPSLVWTFRRMPRQPSGREPDPFRPARRRENRHRNNRQRPSCPPMRWSLVSVGRCCHPRATRRRFCRASAPHGEGPCVEMHPASGAVRFPVSQHQPLAHWEKKYPPASAQQWRVRRRTIQDASPHPLTSSSPCP